MHRLPGKHRSSLATRCSLCYKDAMHAFLLGRIPELSIAEIRSILPEKSITYVSREVLLTDTKFEKPQKFLDRLGGTIKIIKILKKGIKNDIIEKAKGQKKKKLLFSVSAHELDRPHEIRIKTKLLDLKKLLRSQGFTSGYINKKPMNASFVAIKKKGLVELGTDYSYIKTPDGVLEGCTVAIQDFEEYSRRDYNRPNRDAKNGMLPPKIAQIMINLTGDPGPKTILDPFCGSGTVAQEAMLMGKDAIASDKSKIMVNHAKDNIKWLRKEFKVRKTVKFEAKQEDALTLTLPKNAKARDLAIVAEGDLGAPMTHTPTQADLKKLHPELLNFYAKFFTHLGKIAPQGLEIVFAFPAHVTKTGISRIPKLHEAIRAAGFEIANLKAGDYPSLIYKRADQFVAREIIKATKVPHAKEKE